MVAEMFQNGGIDVLVVPECKGKEDDHRRKLNALELKAAFSMRKRSKMSCPGGGVCIIARQDARMELKEMNSSGLLWVVVTPKGRHPVNIIGAYIPTHKSPLTLDNPRIRDQLMYAHAAMVRKAEASGVSTWVAAGDYNFSVGQPKGWGRAASINPKRRDSARDIAVAWANRIGAKTSVGCDGNVAVHTCLVPNAESAVPMSGCSEPDIIWHRSTLAARPLPLTQYPRASGDPEGHRHRMIGVEITVPPPREAQPRRAREAGKPRIQPPEYGDSEAREQWSEDLANRIPHMLEMTSSDVSTEDKMKALVSPLQEVVRDHYTRDRELPRNRVHRLYHGRDVPPAAAVLFEQSRELLQCAKKSSRGAAIYLRSVAHCQRMRGAAIANRHFQATVGRASASLLKSDSAAFHKIMKDGAASGRSPDLIDIPPAKDGTPAPEAFLEAAKELYVETRPDVPALKRKEFWLKHLNKEGNAEMLHSLSREATPEEMAGILFGCGILGNCPPECVRCQKAVAHAEAAKVRPMGRQKKRLRTNKAWGADEIPAEVISWMETYEVEGGETNKGMLAQAFANIYNACLEDGRAPQGFADAMLTPLLKPNKDGSRPDASSFSSYRLISLINIVNKVLMLFLVDRLSHALERCGVFGPEQAGFMFGQATEDAHFWQTHASQRAPKTGEPLYTLWLDLKRAYDNVHQGALGFALSGIGVPEIVVNLIISMISSGSGTLRVNGVTSEPFPLTKGVPQGNPLSCLLFAVFIASLPRYLNDIPELQGHVILGVGQKIQLYADDGACTCRGRDQAELLLHHVRHWATEWGLELNCKAGKTEFSLFGAKSVEDLSPLRPPAHVVVTDPSAANNPDVSRKQHYNYLGAGYDDEDPTWEAAAEAHVKSVWGKYDALRFTSTILSSLPIAQQLQVRETYTPLYLGVFHPLTGPSMREAERKSLNSLEDIFGIRRRHRQRKGRGHSHSSASRLLTYTAMGGDHPMAIALADRFRKLQSYLCHPSRLSSNVLPTCVALFDAMSAEHAAREAAPSTKRQREEWPYNWVSETVTLLRDWTPALPENPFEAVAEWTHEVSYLTRNARSAISYLKLKREKARVLTGEFNVFNSPPQCAGGTKHARFLTGDMGVPDEVLRQPEGIPLSYMGPGLRNPLTLANGGESCYRNLTRALWGSKALHYWPWNPETTEPKPFEVVEEPAEGTYDNWSSSAPCRLCKQADSNNIYHLASICTHAAMAGMRARLRSSMANHAKHLHSELLTVQQAYRGSQKAVDTSTSEDSAGFESSISALANGAFPPAGSHGELEINLYCYRLLLAAPWARRNTAQGHHFAALLGSAFDLATPQHASPRMLRSLALRMCSWGDRWLRRMADAYREALTPAHPPTLVLAAPGGIDAEQPQAPQTGDVRILSAGSASLTA